MSKRDMLQGLAIVLLLLLLVSPILCMIAIDCIWYSCSNGWLPP